MRNYNGFTADQQTAAMVWLELEYLSGRRERLTLCEACGQTHGIFEAHSEDYSAPYGPHIGQVGLCYICYMMVRCRSKAPQAWQNYCLHVRLGFRFEPFHARDWHLFSTTMLKIPLDRTSTEFERPVMRGHSTVLDEIHDGALKSLRLTADCPSDENPNSGAANDKS